MVPPLCSPRTSSGLLTPPPDDELQHHSLKHSLPPSMRRRAAAHRDSPSSPGEAPSHSPSHPHSPPTLSTFSQSDPVPAPQPLRAEITSSTSTKAFDLWTEGRRGPGPGGTPIQAGAHRPLTFRNVALALSIVRESAIQLFVLLWTIHPLRILLFLALNLVRGLFPAARAYSQALLLDQFHAAVTKRVVSPSLLGYVALELFRMLAEAIFEHFATSNERAVQQATRFKVEYVQMETRLRLDIPSLANPAVQDLLSEADLFARSFNGIGSSLGLLSPFDLVRSLTTLASEIIGQSYVLYSLLGPGSGDGSGSTGWTTAQVFLVGSALAPSALAGLNWLWARANANATDGMEDTSLWPHALYNPEEAETAERHERMRRLAYDESFKSEVMLFGLSKWILKTWADTREKLLSADKQRDRSGTGQSARRLFGLVDMPVAMEFARESTRELMITLQAIPLILQLNATSLGNATLYRTSIQTMLSAIRSLHQTFQLTYQSIFLMGAFHAALTLKASMEPEADNRLPYATAPNADGRRRGMKLEARNLYYTYPGETEPVIRGLNLVVQPGEVVAVVGKNGCGKSTLMHLLLRLFDYDKVSGITSQLLINDEPAERYSPEELHSHSSAVFQNFSKLSNGSVRENVGIGNVDEMEGEAVEEALKLGVAADFVNKLKDKIDTRLDVGGFGGGGSSRAWSGISPRNPPPQPLQQHHRTSLSGGQWQRIAVSRSFMRRPSSSPSCDLLIWDEASSQLDPAAQNDIFGNALSLASGRGQRTVVFITHNLSTVGWADKVAYFDEGTIKEFGTHNELLSNESGGYAALWHAFTQTGNQIAHSSSP